VLQPRISAGRKSRLWKSGTHFMCTATTTGHGWKRRFIALRLRTRRALLHGRAATGRLRDLPDRARAIAEPERTDSRIVWWPRLLRRVGDRPLLDYVENKLPPAGTVT